VSESPPPSDPRIAELPVRECGEELIDLRTVPSLTVADALLTKPPGPFLRVTVVDRLVTAQSLLPRDLRVLVIGGHQVSGETAWCRLESALTPHNTGAAADLTLCDEFGAELSSDSPADRRAFSAALTSAGLVKAPTGWWHWSYGDLYWCYRTGADAARYGPVELPH
jgi:D-alanyl-D-alanine dipeptidase